MGRRRELASFDDALAGRSPRRVLFVHGQGGIGKTTLLQRVPRPRARGRPAPSCTSTAATSTRHRTGWTRPSGSPSATTTTASRSRGCWPARSCSSTATSSSPRSTGGCATSSSPACSADTVVVLAGRDPPAAPWRTDPGWRHARRRAPPRPLQPGRKRRTARPRRRGTARPAASGDARPRAPADHGPAGRPRRVRAGARHPRRRAGSASRRCWSRSCATCPASAHLTGLATCAIAWLTTEDLLAQVVGADAAGGVAVAGPTAVHHQPARAGCSPTTWPATCSTPSSNAAHPSGTARYRRIIYAHAVAGLRAATGLDRQLHAQQLLFLLRNNPLADAVSALRARGSATVVPARAGRTRPGLRDHRTVRRTGQRRPRPRLARRAARTPQRRSAPATASPDSPTTCCAPAARRWRTGTRSCGPSSTTSPGKGRSARGNASTSCASRRRPRPPTRPVRPAGRAGLQHHRMADPPARLVVRRRRRRRVLDALLRLHGLRPAGRGRRRRRAARRLRHRLATPARSTPGLDLMHERGRSGGDRTTTGRPAPPAATGPRPASPPRSGPPCRPCTGPTSSPPTRSSAPRWPPDRTARAPTNSGPPSKPPSPTSATNPKATNSGPSCTAPTSAPPPPRKPPPKSSTCP